MKLHSNDVFEVFQLIGTKLSEMPLKWAETIEWLWCEFLRPKTNDCWTKLHYSKLYVISFSPMCALETSLHTFHTQLRCNDVDEKFTLKYSFWTSSLYFHLPTSFVHFSRRISSEKRCSTYCIIRQRKWRRTKVSRNDSKQLKVLSRNVCLLSSVWTVQYHHHTLFGLIVRRNCGFVISSNGMPSWSPGSTIKCESWAIAYIVEI